MSAAGKFESGMVLAGVALVALAAWWLVKHSGLFNPLNQNNLANQGFDSLYQGVTGSQGTLGADIYNWTHPDAGAPTQTPTVPMCYARNPDGSLVYIDGVIQQRPCSQNPPGWQTP